MIVNQLSAFVENKAGRLAEIAETLAANNIDLSAVSLADSADYGVIRMLVSDPELAAKVKLHIPDENSRRVGQSVAAASLPETK